MLNKFKFWFNHSPYGFIIGLILLGIVTAALYLTLFGEKLGIIGLIVGGLIGSTYAAVFNKARDAYRKPYKDGQNENP
ncbi:hypothetical protein [Rheinheimera sp.]|uniref:hypothetical protein n=1 Tax=Rheinheimera sp. TaxID=1869214 RepID=UPI00404763BD